MGDGYSVPSCRVFKGGKFEGIECTHGEGECTGEYTEVWLFQRYVEPNKQVRIYIYWVDNHGL